MHPIGENEARTSSPPADLAEDTYGVGASPFLQELLLAGGGKGDKEQTDRERENQENFEEIAKTYFGNRSDSRHTTRLYP